MMKTPEPNLMIVNRSGFQADSQTHGAAKRIKNDFRILPQQHCYRELSVPCALPVALTSVHAQGRCPGGSAEQAHRREQDQHRIAGTHREWPPVSGSCREVEVRPLGFQHHKSPTAGFSCDASRSSFHGFSLSSKRAQATLKNDGGVSKLNKCLLKYFLLLFGHKLLLLRARRKELHPLAVM